MELTEWGGPLWLPRALGSLREPAFPAVERGVVDPILGAGEDRGGAQGFGGPLWMDWGSFAPIPGINQVVGHTPGDGVREKMERKSRNYCLDVGNASVAAILVDGELEILDGV